MAGSNFDRWLEEEMADPEFRALWEETAPAEEFGLAVALAREARGMTQESLATATGIKRPMIARIEKGNRAPTMPTVLKFVRAFEASLAIDPSGRMQFAPKERAKRGRPVPVRQQRRTRDDRRGRECRNRMRFIGIDLAWSLRKTHLPNTGGVVLDDGGRVIA